MDYDGYDSDKTQPGDRDFDSFAPSLLSENTKQICYPKNKSSGWKTCGLQVFTRLNLTCSNVIFEFR